MLSPCDAISIDQSVETHHTDRCTNTISACALPVVANRPFQYVCRALSRLLIVARVLVGTISRVIGDQGVFEDQRRHFQLLIYASIVGGCPNGLGDDISEPDCCILELVESSRGLEYDLEGGFINVRYILSAVERAIMVNENYLRAEADGPRAANLGPAEAGRVPLSAIRRWPNC